MHGSWIETKRSDFHRTLPVARFGPPVTALGEYVVLGAAICGYVQGVPASLDRMEDAALVAAVVGGEVRAWNALVDRYAQMIWSVGRQSGLPAAESEDLVQIVFTRAIEHIERIEDPAAFGGWVRTVAKREAWLQVARRRRESGGESVLDQEMAQSDEDLDLLVERQQAVRMSFLKLGERCQELVQSLFSEMEVNSYQVLADRLQININSVGPTRRRCLEELQGLLISQYPELFEETS